MPTVPVCWTFRHFADLDVHYYSTLAFDVWLFPDKQIAVIEGP